MSGAANVAQRQGWVWLQVDKRVRSLAKPNTQSLAASATEEHVVAGGRVHPEIGERRRSEVVMNERRCGQERAWLQTLELRVEVMSPASDAIGGWSKA